MKSQSENLKDDLHTQGQDAAQAERDRHHNQPGESKSRHFGDVDDATYIKRSDY